MSVDVVKCGRVRAQNVCTCVRELGLGLVCVRWCGEESLLPGMRGQGVARIPN